MKFLIASMLVISTSMRMSAAYDPLAAPDVKTSSPCFEAKDMKRDRTLPLRVYLPETTKPAPVILFSHGLGGSRDNNPYLGNHWAKRGYVVVFMQHPGSDASVWKDVPQQQRMAAMKKAASLASFLNRTRDVPAVIDALTAWNGEAGHPLHQRMDLGHIGMAGHSFGAITTQAAAGQAFASERVSFAEPRISAAVMMSPSPPVAGDPATAFASIRIPCLLMTGTRDDSPIGKCRAADRLKVFPNLRQAPAWEVVLDDASHMSFGGRDPSSPAAGNSRYHKAVLALTTAFWDAELKGDAEAKNWLNGGSARSVLAEADKWEMNDKARE